MTSQGRGDALVTISPLRAAVYWGEEAVVGSLEGEATLPALQGEAEVGDAAVGGGGEEGEKDGKREAVEKGRHGEDREGGDNGGPADEPVAGVNSTPRHLLPERERERSTEPLVLQAQRRALTPILLIQHPCFCIL